MVSISWRTAIFYMVQNIGVVKVLHAFQLLLGHQIIPHQLLLSLSITLLLTTVGTILLLRIEHNGGKY
jgi:hypothetical protein